MNLTEIGNSWARNVCPRCEALPIPRDAIVHAATFLPDPDIAHMLSTCRSMRSIRKDVQVQMRAEYKAQIEQIVDFCKEQGVNLESWKGAVVDAISRWTLDSPSIRGAFSALFQSLSDEDLNRLQPLSPPFRCLRGEWFVALKFEREHRIEGANISDQSRARIAKELLQEQGLLKEAMKVIFQVQERSTLQDFLAELAKTEHFTLKNVEKIASRLNGAYNAPVDRIPMSESLCNALEIHAKTQHFCVKTTFEIGFLIFVKYEMRSYQKFFNTLLSAGKFTPEILQEGVLYIPEEDEWYPCPSEHHTYYPRSEALFDALRVYAKSEYFNLEVAESIISLNPRKRIESYQGILKGLALTGQFDPETVRRVASHIPEQDEWYSSPDEHYTCYPRSEALFDALRVYAKSEYFNLQVAESIISLISRERSRIQCYREVLKGLAFTGQFDAETVRRVASHIPQTAEEDYWLSLSQALFEALQIYVKSESFNPQIVHEILPLISDPRVRENAIELIGSQLSASSYSVEEDAPSICSCS